VPIHAAGELLGAAWRINLAVAEWAIHKRTLQSVRMATVGSDPHWDQPDQTVSWI